jgi:rhodanese-related sulfurtransferase
MTRTDIKGVFILSFFAVVTAFMFNNLSPSSIALFGQWDVQKGVISANSKTNHINNSLEILDPELVLKIIQSKQRVIFDVRPPEIYDKGHIPSARSFPLTQFDENVPRMFSIINQPDPVLVYCSSAQCTDSHTFAEYLLGMGYTDVKVFSGGFAQWQEQGYEIEKNE